MTSYNIILIGCGNMGSALLNAWYDLNLIQQAQILDPSDQLSEIKQENDMFHVKQAADLDFNDIDICILATKPQILDTVCQDIKPYCDGSFAVLSIAAGKTLSYFDKKLGKNLPIIRTMPNTPAMVQKGFTALIANKYALKQHLDCAQNLFQTCGTTYWLEDEAMMDNITAVSGSGPAYLFYTIEALSKAAIKNGMPHEIAYEAARQTIIGASALAESQMDKSSDKLRQNVTSKGGTTQAGLEVLMDGRFDEILNQTVAAAQKRSRELGE